MSRFAIFFFFLAASIALVSATPSKKCKDSEFWYEAKKCCLPHGGPPSPPKPPRGQECPPTGFYWGSRQACCVPKHPPSIDHPLPQCRKGWSWYPYLHMCLPTPTPPSPPPAHPSGGYGDGKNGGHGIDGHPHHGHSGLRRLKSRTPPLCPGGLDACPLTGGDYECVDTATELESCGGCPSLGQGQDCTAIPGVKNVGCEVGSCVVHSCSFGFRRSPDGKSCLPV